MDFSSIFSAFRPKSPDGGWASGTTLAPEGAFFSRDPQGGIAGLTDAGVTGLRKGLGGAMIGAAAQMPGGFKPPAATGTTGTTGGAFASAPQAPGTGDTPDWSSLIASWRKHMAAPTSGGA